MSCNSISDANSMIGVNRDIYLTRGLSRPPERGLYLVCYTGAILDYASDLEPERGLYPIGIMWMWTCGFIICFTTCIIVCQYPDGSRT